MLTPSNDDKQNIMAKPAHAQSSSGGKDPAPLASIHGTMRLQLRARLPQEALSMWAALQVFLSHPSLACPQDVVQNTCQVHAQDTHNNWLHLHCPALAGQAG